MQNKNWQACGLLRCGAAAKFSHLQLGNNSLSQFISILERQFTRRRDEPSSGDEVLFRTSSKHQTVEVQTMASAAPTASQLAQLAQVPAALTLGPSHCGYTRKVRDCPYHPQLMLQHPLNTYKFYFPNFSISVIQLSGSLLSLSSTANDHRWYWQIHAVTNQIKQMTIKAQLTLHFNPSAYNHSFMINLS